MLIIERLLDKNSIPLQQPDLSLSLPHERRIISRQRVTLDDGSDPGLFLPRGSSLQEGDILQCTSGELIRVQAAPERVSTVLCDDPLLLARACYHLGNRHVPVQIMPTMIRYQHDHVLDEMLHGLGLNVLTEQAPFEPEAGAYAGGHSHSHPLDRANAHAH